uniref:Uncharacterized protein n=1 Tax=Arundo donax TaxID=35708 RepID=A0A0A9DHZ1_ARUDO
MKTMNTLQCSNEVGLKITSPGPKPFQDPSSNLVLIPTNLLTDSRLYNGGDKVLLSHDVPTNGGQGRHGPEGSYTHFENIKDTSSQKSQNTSSNQAIHGKDEDIPGSSEKTMVAIPAIPLALCMPVARNLPGGSADEPCRSLAAPIQAVPISYRPAEPIRQTQTSFCNLGPFAGVLSEPNKQGKGPNPLVHATALACGARVVPLEEAASLIKAVESKIRSGGAIISKLPSSSLIPQSMAMSSSSEDDEENDHSEPLMVDVERPTNEAAMQAVRAEN